LRRPVYRTVGSPGGWSNCAKIDHADERTSWHEQRACLGQGHVLCDVGRIEGNRASA
jgi:hypothetical protein